MSNVTAVILSRALHRRDVPGCEVLNYNSVFSGPAGHKTAWLAALQQVTTEWFFFLDSDDQLPKDFLRILERCLEQGTPVVYTDELRINDAMIAVKLEKGPYSEARLIEKATLLHHLVLCKTELAKRAAKLIPEGGTFAIEPLIFFVAAKEGISYVPEIGYHWRLRAGGNSQHQDSLLAQINSRRWCYQHQGHMPELEALKPPPIDEPAPPPVEVAPRKLRTEPDLTLPRNKSSRRKLKGGA